MKGTPICFALTGVASVIALFASSPAWAPSAPCPTCIIKKTTWAITPSEMVRVCLVGLVTRPPSTAIAWEIGFFDAEGDTVLTKEAEVSQQGFHCVETTAEELRLAGFEAEPSGRLQFGLRIAPQEPIPVFPNTEPEKLTLDGNTYHSVETIDVLSQATTSSDRFAHPDFLWDPRSLPASRRARR